MRTAAAAALIVLVVMGGVHGRFAPADVQNVPVDRVVGNLERQLSDDPKNVEILVNLARAHAMAFASKSVTVPTSPPGRVWLGQGVPPYRQFPVKETNDARAAALAQLQLAKAIGRYKDALALDPANEVAALGLGWAQLQHGDSAAAVATLRALIARSWPRDASTRDHAFTPMHGQPFVTEEAAAYLIPLLDAVRDADEIATLRQRIRTLEKKPRWITPIAVPLADDLDALAIVDEQAEVPFDLDGTGARRWTWLRPNAAWLVFDRHGGGEIRSGLQLFGSVTFWMFWANGYHALRALDDDGDREVRGVELAGLALWHDRNSNGISERGEVRSVGDWGIVALSCVHARDAAHPDEIAFSPRGVTFRNGATRPTYDVVLHSRPGSELRR